MPQSSEPGAWSGDPELAATVVLVRSPLSLDDGSSNLEVLLLERNNDAVFAPGALVFPGGRVEPEDGSLEWEEVAGHDDEAASAELGLVSGGLAFYIAAIRECFEECGILLGLSSGAGVRSRLARLSNAPADNGSNRPFTPQSVKDIYGDELTGPATKLVYLGRRITPIGPPRRFDTRFFAAEVGASVPVEVDGAEIVNHAWMKPMEALAMNRKGEIKMLAPTIQALEVIARACSFGDVADPCKGLRL